MLERGISWVTILSMINLDTANPFRSVGDGVRDTGHGIHVEYFHRERINPLITQQDVAIVLIQLGKSLPIEKRSLLFDELVKTDRSTLERMLCGPASALTCLRSLQSENTKPPTGLVNSTHITSLLAAICSLEGSASTNPQTGSLFDKGWQVFSRTNANVMNWEIYHHALAYGIDKLSNGMTITKGIMRFATEDISTLIRAGSKVIVSVSNTIVGGDQMYGRAGNVLREGSHLVAIVGYDIDPGKVYLADPYVEPFSEQDVDAVPRLISLDILDRFLKLLERRRGLVISDVGQIPAGLISHIEYPLAKPNT